MKKGCLIGIIVFFAVVLIGAIVSWIVLKPRIMKGATAGIILGVEMAIEEYTEATGAPPQGDHEQILKALMGDNPEKKNFFGSDLTKALRDGKIVDTWQNTLLIKTLPDGVIDVRSAGPNGNFGDDDDVTSAALKNLIQNLEEKAEASAKEGEEVQ